jgi:TP901 family phage tail tape measure protein
VDVATSTKNLIAIQRGFGFSSNDLLKIYDQINQAQNTFGISIGDTEAGLAKAGGTFRNAGGDLNYLLGLFVAISKATGRSGTEIGTGIARAANQIRKPASQAALRGLGVDVDPNNLQLTIQRGIARARQPGADYNAIAAGLFGNQYARLIAPVLRDPSGLQAALGGTSPEASKDSAKKELAKRREQIDYQLKEIGVNMQRIGEALGRSGAFDAIGGLVKGLNGVLKLTLDVVNAFDKLPAPIREAAVLMGELYLTMRLLRRFGVTDRIGAGLGFEGAQNRQVARGVGMGLESGQQAARNEYERLSRQSVVAHTTANIRQDAAAALRRDYERRTQQGAIPRNSEAQLAAQQKVIQAENAAAAAATRSAELEIEVASAREQVLLYERDIANIKKIEAEAGARGVAAYAEQNALYTRDAKGNVGRVGAGVGGVGGAEAAKIAEEDAARQAAAIEAASMRTLGPVEKKVAPLSGRLRDLGASSNTVLGRLNPLSGAARVGGARSTRARPAYRRSAASIKGIGGGLARFAAALGPLDYALVGFIAFTAINDWGNKKLIEDQTSSDRGGPEQRGSSGRTGQAPDAGQRRVHTPLRQPHRGEPSHGRIAHDVTSGRIFDPNYENASDRDSALRQESCGRAGREQPHPRPSERRAAQGPYHAIPLQFYGQITKEMAQEQKQRLAGVISEREFDKLLAKNALEIKTARGDQGARNRALAELNDLKRRNAAQTHFGQRYDSLDPKDLQKELEGRLNWRSLAIRWACICARWPTSTRRSARRSATSTTPLRSRRS